MFDGDTARAPTGVAIYKRPRDGQLFAIVGGKGGPTYGTYLAQYPDSGSTELASFATTGVTEDHEGLAMNGNPHSHPLLAIIPVRAQQTDGLEITNESLGPSVPRGMLAMMSNRGAFHFCKWEDVDAAIDRVRAQKKQ